MKLLIELLLCDVGLKFSRRPGVMEGSEADYRVNLESFLVLGNLGNNLHCHTIVVSALSPDTKPLILKLR